MHADLYPRVVAYAMRRTMNHASADEIAAEAFVVAWRRREEQVRDPLAWLLGIARGVVANHLRAEGRRDRLASRLAAEWTAQSSDPAQLVADRDELLSALAGLGEDDRELLILLSWDRLDRGQAAAVLGCGRAALAVRLHRARRRLEAQLKQSPEEVQR